MSQSNGDGLDKKAHSRSLNSATTIEEKRAELKFHEGPLPAPWVLREYDEVCPGAADRILKMTEQEGIERHNFNREALRATIADTKRGMYLAFFLAILLISGGFLLLAWDKYITGTLFSGAGLSIVLSAFINNKRNILE
ncbi:DUF2335 domain-containing protein [uncultured Veillonella sp.]|jgi:uncharacterized membrane protein|uniref:DUF2335 domain-containing protein n=1 Tax=uncultured Veillonella sp. TaxID=159268 RepID=UPI00258EAFC3|nr:DUF2335 domain-containing protein [uncultured Veillonella sp.]